MNTEFYTEWTDDFFFLNLEKQGKISIFLLLH